MTFGEVVRTERMKKGLTQEKLGEMLGVSSQAVSKWETTGCYPDAELLVPLANALDVSLDALFRNGQVTERDAALMVFSLMQKENEREGGKPFELIRRLCWVTQGAWFGIYDPTPAADGMSSITDDDGFTEVSCEPYAPFFSVFPEPENGWGEAVGDGEEIRCKYRSDYTICTVKLRRPAGENAPPLPEKRATQIVSFVLPYSPAETFPPP